MYDYDSAMRAYREDVGFRTLVSTLEAGGGRVRLHPVILTALEAKRFLRGRSGRHHLLDRDASPSSKQPPPRVASAARGVFCHVNALVSVAGAQDLRVPLPAVAPQEVSDVGA